MGKVNLNKASKSDKNADFKQRKSFLGRGKHQHMSHTKIDLQTAKIKVPTQYKFENTEVEVSGPTYQQLVDLISMCHSETDKKVLNGITGIQSIISKDSDLFIHNSSAVLAAILVHLRNGEQQIREAAQNLVSYLFSRHSAACSPFIPVLVRHIHAIICHPSNLIKSQASMLLEKISQLPNLVPSPPLFSVFQMFFKSISNSAQFCQFSKSIIKVLSRFTGKSKDCLSVHYKSFCFPKLFPTGSATFNKRFTRVSVLGSDELDALDQLCNALLDCLPFIKGDNQKELVPDFSKLLLVVLDLNPHIDISLFVSAFEEIWPIEDAPIKKNLIVARVLAFNENNHGKIREYFADIKLTNEAISLFASVGSEALKGLEALRLDDSTVSELCSVKISRSSAPIISISMIDYIAQTEKPTKRAIKTLIGIQKGNGFQEKLLIAMQNKLSTSSESFFDLYIELISSCAPHTKEFLKGFSLLISSDDFPNDRATQCLECIELTHMKADLAVILSFFLSVGNRKPSLKEFCRSLLLQIERSTNIENKHMFNKINLESWTIN